MDYGGDRRRGNSRGGERIRVGGELGKRDRLTRCIHGKSKKRTG